MKQQGFLIILLVFVTIMLRNHRVTGQVIGGVQSSLERLTADRKTTGILLSTIGLILITGYFWQLRKRRVKTRPQVRIRKAPKTQKKKAFSGQLKQKAKFPNLSKKKIPSLVEAMSNELASCGSCSNSSINIPSPSPPPQVPSAGSCGSVGGSSGVTEGDAVKQHNQNATIDAELILYYASWCGYSVDFVKKNGPWETFIKYAKNNNLGIKITEVKCNTKEGETICDRAGIRGYPTIKLRIGSKIHDLHGDRARGIPGFNRNVTGLIDFVKYHTS